MVVISNLHFDVGGKGQIEMEGRERQRASGHGDQKLQNRNTSAQRKAIRACWGNMILQFSHLRSGLPVRGGGLFFDGLN